MRGHRAKASPNSALEQLPRVCEALNVLRHPLPRQAGHLQCIISLGALRQGRRKLRPSLRPLTSRQEGALPSTPPNDMAEPLPPSMASVQPTEPAETPAEHLARQHSPTPAPTLVETAPAPVVTAESLVQTIQQPPAVPATAAVASESSTPPVPLDPSGTRPTSEAEQAGESARKGAGCARAAPVVLLLLRSQAKRQMRVQASRTASLTSSPFSYSFGNARYTSPLFLHIHACSSAPLIHLRTRCAHRCPSHRSSALRRFRHPAATHQARRGDAQGIEEECATGETSQAVARGWRRDA